MLDEETFIENVQQVIDEVQSRYLLKVAAPYVREQFKLMNIKWKRVKHIAVQGNSERSLVLRQRWAVSFLEMSWKHKNVINIDETWLGMSDFRR